MKNRKDELISGLESIELSLSDHQIEQFLSYYDLLIEWNEKINLTAITEFHDVVYKHFIDSLCIKSIIDMTSIESMIDVGTGAGFPGIPIKILYPDIKITLMDSLKKRLSFLDIVIANLSLSNIFTTHGRAEDLGHHKDYRENYDLCVSRAVANLSTLTELCIPFVRTGGYFISYKSEKANEELDTAKKSIYLTGGKINQVQDFVLPNTDMKRCFIVIQKETNTSSKYPRKAGVPQKNPL